MILALGRSNGMKNDFRDYLCHYGVKGMKWGVRRYQNPDGSLTEEGIKRYRAANRVRRYSNGDVDDILKSMDNDDKDKVLDGSDHYLNRDELSNVSRRVVIRDKNEKAVSFFDCMDDGNEINVALGTRSGKQYRNKGYSSKAARQALKYLKRVKKPNQKVVWGVRVDNAASIHLAEKHGFKMDPNSYSDNKKWVNYIATIKQLKV